MDTSAQHYADRAFQHIVHLSHVIGPRPSTGVGERDAAAYVAQVLRDVGVGDVRVEAFTAPRSTYAPYRRCFAAALIGTCVAHMRTRRSGALLGAVLNGLAAYGFFAEADLAPSWVRCGLPQASSQNVVGMVPAAEVARQRLVIYGHLDTHRTPIFYRSARWLQVFSLLLGAGFISMATNTLLYAVRVLCALPPPGWGRMSGYARAMATLLQFGGFALTLHADQTPFTCGANDNASGVASVLALAERLVRAPLRFTDVWIVGTGCEEIGAYGIAALLDRHYGALEGAALIDFDMVGIGDPAYISSQGLLRRRSADGQLLASARATAAAHAALGVWEHVSTAFDDSYMVARRGFRGMTIDAEGRPGSFGAAEQKHWHRLSDTHDKMSCDTLGRVHAFAWQLLHHVDTELSISGYNTPR